jgi:hypothetical protein
VAAEIARRLHPGVSPAQDDVGAKQAQDGIQ